MQKIRLSRAEDGRIASEERYQNMRFAQHRASRAPSLLTTIAISTCVLKASLKRTSRFNKQTTSVLSDSDSPYGVLRILYSASVFGVRFFGGVRTPPKFAEAGTRAPWAASGCSSQPCSPRHQTPQLRRKSLEPKYYSWSDDFMLFLLNRMVFVYLFSGVCLIGFVVSPATQF